MFRHWIQEGYLIAVKLGLVKPEKCNKVVKPLLVVYVILL